MDEGLETVDIGLHLTHPTKLTGDVNARDSKGLFELGKSVARGRRQPIIGTWPSRISRSSSEPVGLPTILDAPFLEHSSSAICKTPSMASDVPDRKSIATVARRGDDSLLQG
jgi:hypothetical protein